MNWREFASAAPELAEFALGRMKADGLVVLGTLRVDGWPRISPCEAYVVDGELLLGMMWQSKKALDLLRDPRIAMATVQDDREAKHGDLKLYGTVRDVPERERRQAYSDALFAAIAWRPSEPYHLFALEIERAGFITFDNDRRLIRWSVDSGMEVLRHPDPSPP